MILNRALGSTLLVAGTCIGAGMLALPVSLTYVGFYGAGVMIFLAWLLMTITGLLVVEVNVKLKGRASYISMAEHTLGVWGRRFTWVCFLLLLYALMAAYISGGAALVTGAALQLAGAHWTLWQGLVPWVVVFGFLVYLGTQAVDVINKCLVLGLVLAYGVLLAVITPSLHWQPSAHVAHPNFYLAALPILMTSYGYHIVIPSVSQYLNHDVVRLKKAVIGGSLAALLVYLVWEYLILGVLPIQGAHGLQAILQSGQPADTMTQALSVLTGQSTVGLTVRCFAFFALCSSFIGVALGLFHLLCDGLHLSETALGKLMGSLLTFAPPIVFALTYPRGFIMALGFAGTLVALIHGVLPAVMAWRLRGQGDSYQVQGGKPLLVAVCLVSVIVMLAELLGVFGFIPKL